MSGIDIQYIYKTIEEDAMTDYPAMYHILCAAASEAVDLIENGNADRAARLLRRALLEAEECYIVSCGNETP